MNVHLVPKLLEYHGDMLEDGVRVSAFRRALDAVVTPGAVVLDLGAGTGILSALACRAGASRVYVIEEGPVMAFAEEVLRANGFTDRVVHVRGLSTDSHLPEPVDVIVSETIGVAGFDEGILGYVIDARRRFAHPGGPAPRVIPARMGLWVAPVCAGYIHDHLVGRWAQGLVDLELGALRERAPNHLYIRRIEPEWLAAPGQQVARVDLATAETPFVEGQARFSFARPTTVHGFAVWFDAELADGITLSNAPAASAADRQNVGQHWSHGFLPVRDPLELAAGAALTLRLQVNDGTLWHWQGAADPGQAFDQCTTFGVPIDRAALRG